ncbi:MAG: hypothetical protein ACI31F_06970 [Muribaculaceae bacterium]
MNLEKIASSILKNLTEKATKIVSGSSLSSPRAVGDAVQDYLGKTGLELVLNEYGIDVSSDFSRRSMEDMAFKDAVGNYYAVDVKTHNVDTDFNMPNLISVKRLATFYKNDDKNNFCILIVSYKVIENEIKYTRCDFKRIESFDWSCLTLGALGWGQIQIANANKLKFLTARNTNRKQWMLDLCEKLFIFYDEEISKIGERKTWFNSIKSYWLSKP